MRQLSNLDARLTSMLYLFFTFLHIGDLQRMYEDISS